MKRGGGLLPARPDWWPKGEKVLITDASDVVGDGTIYQWQELNPAELTHCQYRTSGLIRDGSLKHDYPSSEW